MSLIGDRVKHFRKLNRWTQEELSVRAGYTDRSSIAHIESGRIDVPQSKILDLCRVFGIEPSDLLGDTDASTQLTEEEKRILCAYRSADPVTQRHVRLLLEVEE